ncbi:MAG: 16S rRNA (uracil(1498)-N(3))-methyltransferase [Alphaproteobacteria bacterium]|nr:16S rRNA (uracil(1498)-N(3))-methyltransferase [Alphaproteobacteria bacterium]
MARRFRAPRLPPPGERVQLAEAESHHLLHVTLLPRGEALVAFDGDGFECDARLIDVLDGRAVIEATSPVRRTSPPRAGVLIAALTRKPAWEGMLRMATELGVTELRPFVGRRSVARGEHLERWARIVAGAAGQCGRGDVPDIRPVQPLERCLEGCDGLRRLALVPGAPLADRVQGAGVAVLIGPEGGLDPAELALADEAGFSPAGLSAWTLRADTAAVAALARLLPDPTP